MRLLFILMLFAVCSSAEDYKFYSENGKYFIVFTIDGTVEIKEHSEGKNRVLYKKKDVWIEEYSASWNNGMVFFNYGDYRGGYGGIYDVKNNKLLCKDSLKKYKALDEVGWIDDDEMFVTLDNAYATLLLINDKCLITNIESNIKDVNDAIKNLKPQNPKSKDYMFKLLDIVNMYKAGFYDIAIGNILKLKVPKPIDGDGIDYGDFLHSVISQEELKGFASIYFFEKHIKQKIDDIDIKMISRYIFRASLFGYTDAEKEGIAVYRKSLKYDKKYDTKLARQYLRIFEANYMLSLGKDKEAYAMLLENMPYEQEAKDLIVLYSEYDIPLNKDKKKLSYIFELDKSKLDDFRAIDAPERFIMPDGTIVEKNKTKKNKKKKDDSIELLD